MNGESLKSQENNQEGSSKWDMSDAPEFSEKPLDVSVIEESPKVELTNYNIRDNANNQAIKPEVTIDGETRRSTNFLLGKNKNGLKIENGEYVEKESVVDAIKSYIDAQPEGTQVVRISPEKTFETSEEFMDELMEATERANIIKTSEQIKQRNGAVYSHTRITSPETTKEAKGIFLFSGKSEFKLPSGEYVSARVIYDAAKNYILRTPIEKPELPPEEPTEEPIEEPIDKPTEEPRQPIEKPEKHERDTQKEKYFKVIRRIRNAAPAVIVGTALATAAVTALVLFPTPGQEVYASSRETVRTVDYSESENADFELSQEHQTTVSDEELTEESLERMQDTFFTIETGDKINIPEGVDYYRSSDSMWHDGIKGTVGEGLRQAGEYTANYFSAVTKDGRIVDVAFKEGMSLGDFLEEASTKANVPKEELHLFMHIDGPTAGWMLADDIIHKTAEDEVSKMDLEDKIRVDGKDRFDGAVRDFTGEVSFQNKNGETVTVRLVDDNGNLLAKGSTVVGSDGKEYYIENLSSEKVTTANVNIGEQVTNYTETKFSLSDALARAAMVAGAGLLAGALAALYKKKENVKMTIPGMYGLIDRIKGDSEESFYAKAEKLLEEKGLDHAGVSTDDAIVSAWIGRNLTIEEVQQM